MARTPSASKLIRYGLWFKRNPCPYYYTYWVSTRVQWFWFFLILSPEQPIPDTLRTQGFWNWQNKISTSSIACEFFGKNRKMHFFGIISKFNFRNPFWRANFLCGESIAPRIYTTCYNCCQACVILSVILMGLSLENRETKKNCKYIWQPCRVFICGIISIDCPLINVQLCGEKDPSFCVLKLGVGVGEEKKYFHFLLSCESSVNRTYPEWREELSWF